MSDTKAKSSARAVFTDYLEERRLRKTPERFFILDRVMEMKDHFLVEDLCAVLDQESYHVSRATVYNTLDRLEDCGLVRRHQFGEPALPSMRNRPVRRAIIILCVSNAAASRR